MIARIVVRPIVAVWIVAVVFGACTPAGGDPAAPVAVPRTDAERIALLDAFVEEALGPWKVPGLSIAVVRRDGVVHARGYGVRELGGNGPVGEHTIFAVASNTKPFTAALVATLVHEGAFDWDDRVAERVPGFALHDAAAAADFRIRDLLCHRSGHATFAGDLVWIGSDFDAAEVLRRARFVEPSWPARYRYGYSNLMFAAAGAAIEAATGETWEAVLRRRILEPLGMTRTVIHVADLAGMDDVAVPHMEIDGETTAIPYLPVDNALPAAALNASAADMGRWLRMQLGDGAFEGRTVVPAEAIADTRVPNTAVPISPRGRELIPERHLQSYALGWYLWDYRGRLVINHDGGLPGMFSLTAFVPEADLGVAVLCNAESLLTRAVLLRAIDLFTDAPDRDWSGHMLDFLRRAEAEAAAREEADAGSCAPEGCGTPCVPPSPPLDAYVGRYENPLLGAAEVTLGEGRLAIRLTDHGGLDGPLEPTGCALFHCVWSNPIFVESDVTFDVVDAVVRSLSFQVVPDFIDPVAYEFVRVDSRGPDVASPAVRL